jgi:uncharacterized protein (UPF0128 family)
MHQVNWDYHWHSEEKKWELNKLKIFQSIMLINVNWSKDKHNVVLKHIFSIKSVDMVVSKDELHVAKGTPMPFKPWPFSFQNIRAILATIELYYAMTQL